MLAVRMNNHSIGTYVVMGIRRQQFGSALIEPLAEHEARILRVLRMVHMEPVVSD